MYKCILGVSPDVNISIGCLPWTYNWELCNHRSELVLGAKLLISQGTWICYSLCHYFPHIHILFLSSLCMFILFLLFFFFRNKTKIGVCNPSPSGVAKKSAKQQKRKKQNWKTPMQLILSWSPQWNPSGTGQTKKSFNTWSRHPLSWKFCSTFFFLLLCILLLCQAKRSTLMNFGDTHWMPNKTSIISQNFQALTRWIRIWHVNSLTLYKQHLLAKGQPLFIRWSIIKNFSQTSSQANKQTLKRAPVFQISLVGNSQRSLKIIMNSKILDKETPIIHLPQC